MNEQLITKAITKLKPTAEFSFTDGDYSSIKWDKLDGVAPTQAEIDAAIKVIEAEDKAATAQRVADKAALLERLGITADEAALLLG
jgi:hypothetical protein